MPPIQPTNVQTIDIGLAGQIVSRLQAGAHPDDIASELPVPAGVDAHRLVGVFADLIERFGTARHEPTPATWEPVYGASATPIGLVPVPAPETQRSPVLRPAFDTVNIVAHLDASPEYRAHLAARWGHVLPASDTEPNVGEMGATPNVAYVPLSETPMPPSGWTPPIYPTAWEHLLQEDGL